MAMMKIQGLREVVVELMESAEEIKMAAKTNNVVCAICVVNLSECEGRYTLATSCGHVFHDECLKKWFETRLGPENEQFNPRTKKRRVESGPCPTCGGEIELDKCTKIFLQSDGEMTLLNSSMTTRFRDVAKMLDDAKEALDDAKNEATKFRDELSLVKSELIRQNQSDHVLKMEAEAAKMQAEAVKKEVEATKMETEAAKMETEAAKMETEAAKMEAETVKKEVEAIKKEVEAIKKEVEAAKMEAEATKKEAEREKEKRRNCQIMALVHKKKSENAEKELGQLKNEYSKCEQHNLELSAFFDRVAALLNSHFTG